MELLNKIQQELKVPKAHRNSFGNYNYRNCEDILEAVKPLLGNGILTISDEIVMLGDRFYVKATATLRMSKVVGKLPDEEATVTAYARESDDKKGMDAAQITGAASSYARKYALNGLFLIDDTKDADSYDGNAASKAPETPKTAPVKRANPPAYKSDAIKEQEAKKRIAGLVGKLNPEAEVQASNKEWMAKWYGDEVFRHTGRSLNLATLEELESIGDELGKLFDSQA